ncbi:MAG: hypothetical protein R6U57_03895 [Anaerolineales bacterium]
MDVAKILLWAILVLLAVIVFFALTDIDPQNPMPGIERLLGQVVQFGQSINAAFDRLADNFMRRLRGIPNP